MRNHLGTGYVVSSGEHPHRAGATAYDFLVIIDPESDKGD
jgi:hypothetical protein